MFQADLAHGIEIQFLGPLEGVEDLQAFPTGICKSPTQSLLLTVDIVLSDHGSVRRGKDQVKNRSPVTKRETGRLLSGRCVGDVDIVVAMRVPSHRKGGGAVPEIGLKGWLSSERQRSDHRMQAVGADDEIERAGLRALELDPDVVFFLAESPDLVAEDRFDPITERSVDAPCQIASAYAEELVVQRAAEACHAEPANAGSRTVDDADLAHLVAVLTKCRHQIHALGDVEARTPEIDDVAAGTQRRGALDNGWGESIMGQPIGEGWAGYPRSRYQNRVHFLHSGRPIYLIMKEDRRHAV